MSLRFPKWILLVGLLLPSLVEAQQRELRVCADPDNLPFSNTKKQGFENKITEMIGRDLHARISYKWQRMGRGYVRSILNAAECDFIPGIPANFKPVLTTSPYYKSTYVFVSRRDKKLNIRTFDDPELRKIKIGVQVLDEDYAPPGRALGRRSLVSNIVGYETEDDPGSLVRAVASGAVDVGVVWGPLAGYFAKKQAVALKLEPVTPEIDPPGLPFTFEIAMGVRKSDKKLRDELQEVLEKRKPEITRILSAYGVPQLPMKSTGAGSGR